MELDLNVVGIRWKKMLSNGSEIDLYKFINLAHNQIRPGSSIDNRELKRGNASLTLQHMQKSDEGEYTCIVFITPYKASAKMDVQLLAQPNVYLSSTSPLSNSELTVVEGKESSVTCEVSNYYPEKVKIRWRKYKKGFGIGSPMDKFTYFTVPKENSDESFTVTSLLTLKPSILEEDGDVCYCIVTHASFSHDRNISFTIRVKEPEADKHLLAGTIIPSVLLCLVVVTLVTLYCKPAPPKVSEFVGLSDLFHGKRSTLSCMVSGFNPKNIEILFYLKRTDGLTFLINSWKYPSPPVQCNDTVDNAGHTESQPLSSRNSSRNNSVMELAVIPQPKRSYFLYSFLHSIHITPDIEKDNGADLKMIVIHSALKYPLCIQHTLRIKGDLLKLSVIRHPQYFKHGEEVTLTCDMSKYVQGSLNISWLKKDLMKEKPSLNIHSKGKTRDVKYKHEHTAEEKRGHLYISSSSLTFNLNVKEDHGTKYICTAHNPKTGQSVQSFLEIFVTGCDPLEGRESSARFRV
uniref:Ig-like domain-containing protein n=1 Tax=Pyxicephalus adspersus TaxID=30357 RepID=A0AAV3A1Z0_PYXAD|nr:TPA: hypothetical protein GDO54_003024 [Pyxicephalus adspersus]